METIVKSNPSDRFALIQKDKLIDELKDVILDQQETITRLREVLESEKKEEVHHDA